ncbi:MAG TPA: extracellular solute-binding protein, partial [Urbifossiella sp.]|nr:extracellular solute-binding protein [Urbifossiella sp.]
RLAAWDDLLKPDVRVAVPNPAAAVGKLARDHLERTHRWAALRPRAVDTGTVTEAANAARTGAADAAVVWDAVAAGPHYQGQQVLDLPELHGVEGRIEVAVLTQSADPAAARAFAAFLADPVAGLGHFRAAGFRVIDQPDR